MEQQEQTEREETKVECPERCETILNRAMNLDFNKDFREKVAELQKKLYKGHQTMYEEGQAVPSEAHVQDLNFCGEKTPSGRWSIKEKNSGNSCRDSMDETVPVRDVPSKKVGWFCFFSGIDEKMLRLVCSVFTINSIS